VVLESDTVDLLQYSPGPFTSLHNMSVCQMDVVTSVLLDHITKSMVLESDTVDLGTTHQASCDVVVGGQPPYTKQQALIASFSP